MSIPPMRRVTPEQLRKMFNEGNYYHRSRRGEFVRHVLESDHAPPLADEPFCTLSQIIAYWDRQGKEIARVHRYIRPDGTMGASGLEEPKRLLHEGILYFVPASSFWEQQE